MQHTGLGLSGEVCVNNQDGRVSAFVLSCIAAPLPSKRQTAVDDLGPVYTKRKTQIFPRVLASHLHENPVFNHRKRLFLKTLKAEVEISDLRAVTCCRVNVTIGYNLPSLLDQAEKPKPIQ